MCGIVGVISKTPVNQLIYDALLLLQHRGQDAAGIVTAGPDAHGRKFFMHKARGMVKDVFRTRNMRALPGTVGLGQVRYPTAGNAFNEEEAQPFYVNAPFGLVLVHNGNLTNAHDLRKELFDIDRRHLNTASATEVLLNVFAHELELAGRDLPLTPAAVFKAVRAVHKRIKGSYAVICLIAGYGLVAFRDPYGIRPMCYGEADLPEGREVMVASESVALEGTSHRFVRDVKPGEALFIDLDGVVHAEQCADHAVLNPCMFEYVYLARPDSVIDGVSVYQARLEMGETLAQRVISTMPPSEIDVVIPIPESSRPSAMQLAQRLGKPYREGFVKNRYVGRTFIMPGQGVRKESVQMAREAGANKVYMASAAPPVRFPNVYGIDMPTKAELIAHDRSLEEIRAYIGADALIYQDLEAMKKAVWSLNPALQGFEASCFDGRYITGDVSAEDFDAIREQRTSQPEDEETASRSRLA